MSTTELSQTGKIMSAQVMKARDFRGGFLDIFNNKNYTSVRTLVRNVGMTDAKKLLYVLMHSFLVDRETKDQFLDVEPSAVNQLIDNVLENYEDVSIEDMAHFAKRLVRGEFIGKKINETTIKVFKYDVPTLCLMFQVHYAERITALVDERQKANNELKKNDTIHPDILKMFEENQVYNGIYENIGKYCEANDVEEIRFNEAYELLYGELGHESMTKDEFTMYMKQQFLVVQNQIITGSRTKVSHNMTQLITFCDSYDIMKLTEMCKRLGMWMIPTKYYHAAKTIITEGGHVKFKYDLTAANVKILSDFTKRIIADEGIAIKTKLFVVAMVFNFALHLKRFEKYNYAQREN